MHDFESLNLKNMKKLFFSLMLIASLAFGFTSCDKTASESDTHSQTFTLGETTYDINNAITIENIQYDGSQIYNAIVLSNGQIVGNGGNGHGIIIVFRGDILAGTYTMSYDPLNPNVSFPKYFFAEIDVEDIVDFNIDDLMEQDGVYVASSGSFTLEIDEDIYTITTDGIEVEQVKDAAAVETSSADYEGSMLRYTLATVEEGNINGDNIVTAGATKFTYLMMEMKVVCFITETGNMLGYVYTGTSIPTGTIDNANLIYVNGMNINGGLQAGQGTITIEKEGDVYTVDIPDATIGGVAYTMHYVGTLPYFDFPF